jgi:BioD-like phosphotransacetylase family protein
MATKIFIAASGQNIGKTTVSISLLHRAQQKYGRVGFMKPLGPKPAVLRGQSVDKDAALIAQVFGLSKDLRYMSPVVVYPETSRQAIDGEISFSELSDRILTSYCELEKRCDFIVIEGSGHPGVGSVLKLSNARIARMLDAPVLMVTGGGVGNVIDTIAMNTALFKLEGAEVRGVLVNKIYAEKREIMLDYLRRALTDEPFSVIGGFDYKTVLANPTLRRISRLLDIPFFGNRREVSRIINHVQIGAASTQRVTEMLKESSLLLVTSSRDELLVTLANLYQMPEYRPLISGLIIPGIAPVSTITQRILDRSNIPYLRTQKFSTAELYRIITEDVSKITAEDTEKLDLIRSLADDRLDFETIDALFAPDQIDPCCI